MNAKSVLHRLAAVVLVWAAASLPVRADDMARTMPADTAVYIGWSAWYGEDSPELLAEKTMARAALGFVAQKQGEPQIEQFAGLLDAALLLDATPGALGLFDVVFDGDIPDVQIALVVGAGEKSQTIADALRETLGRFGAADMLEERGVRDAACTRLAIDDGTVFYWAVHKGHFVITAGETAMGKVIDCIDGNAPNLAAAAEFAFDRRKTGGRTDGKHFCFYVDVQRVVSRGRSLIEELGATLPPQADQLLDELGIRSVRSKYLHYEERDGVPRWSGFAHVDGPMKGLLRIWQQKPLTDDDLRIVPQSAYWAEVGNLDLYGLWEETQRVLETVVPEWVPMVEGSLAMVRQIVGFSPTADVLAALGDTWAVFDAPDHGGLLLTGTVLVVEVKDADAIQGMLDRLIGFLTPMLEQEDVRLTLKKTQHGAHEIHYLLIGGVPSPLIPSWAFVNDRWIFGVFPQTVATAARQVDPATRGPSLLDRADFKAARARLPQSAMGVSFYDSQYLSRMFFPILNGFQSALISTFAAHGTQIDLALMPPVDEFVSKVHNFVGTASRDDDGILYVGSGHGVPLAAIAGGAVLSGSILLPSVMRAREVAKRTVSAANLLGIGQGCIIYACDNAEKLPESFEVLIDEGIITREMLRSPRAPEWEDVSYVLVASGRSTGEDPRNVLAYEKVYDAEGTNVLFMDAHVEWMTVDAFRAAVRETFKRLDRESEMPAEFRE